MSKVVFTGCSFTAGNGWNNCDDIQDSFSSHCKDSVDLWVNLCYNQLDELSRSELLNYGVGGASNTEIFINTIRAITEHSDIDTIFCQWTSMPRYNFHLGLELWSTKEGIGKVMRPEHDVKLSDGTVWSRKYIEDVVDRFRVLHHLHGEILKVVEYSNILEKQAKKFNIKIYFINGMCPWDNDYFVRLAGVMPEQFTPFTKKEILNIESRSDQDIFKLYKQIHDEYDQSGGINKNLWVNLYNSMKQDMLDTNYDNKHPGRNSNQLYFQQIKTFLKNQHNAL